MEHDGEKSSEGKLRGRNKSFLKKYLKMMKIGASVKPEGGPVVKNPHANAGDTDSIPDLERCHMLWST